MSSDLQATHQVLSLLEASKSFSDRMLDQLSGVFCVIDSEGGILRGNYELSQVLGVGHEELLGQSIEGIFSAEDWGRFQAYHRKLISDQLSDLEFELPIGEPSHKKLHVWTLTSLTAGSGSHGVIGGKDIFLCLGKDVSELLSAHEAALELERDLQVVEVVQRLFLPPKSDFNVEGLSVSSFFVPAEISSGDYWWFEEISEGVYTVVLIDVTGHGVGPAMVTGLTAGVIRSFFRLKKMNPKIENRELLSSIHEVLCSLPDQGYGMTATLVEINTNTKTLDWVGASPPLFFLLNPEHKSSPLFISNSNPLGYGDLKVSGGQRAYEKGDILILATDGVFELANPDGVQLGERRVQRLLDKCAKGVKGSEVRSLIVDLVEGWRAGTASADDVSAVVVEFLV